MTKEQPPGGTANRHPLPASLVHDLRTPLGQIIGYAELLIEETQEAGGQPSLTHLQKIRAAGLRILALIEQSIEPVCANDSRDEDLSL